jgi:hypothetical protein
MQFLSASSLLSAPPASLFSQSSLSLLHSRNVTGLGTMRTTALNGVSYGFSFNFQTLFQALNQRTIF